MRAHRAGARHGRDTGAIGVRWGIALPVVLLVAFGMVDVGRLLNAQIALTAAAHDSAVAESLGALAEEKTPTATTNVPQAGTGVESTCPAGPNRTDQAVVVTHSTFTFVTPVGAIAGFFRHDANRSVLLTGRSSVPCLR